MRVNSSLEGRLRNTSLPLSHGLLPIFEAVVNSIHAIEEKGNLNKDGKVTVEIKRLNQENIDIDSRNKINKEPIIGFDIIDNGIGFNKSNFESFKVLDSEYKIKKGGKGIGRLMWLKAFGRVEIKSVFRDDEGKNIERTFKFNRNKWIHEEQCKEVPGVETGTKVSLIDFESKYRESIPSGMESIASHLLEHCLWYFIRRDFAPSIILKDGDKEQGLHELYDKLMYADTHDESILIKNIKFNLIHLKLRRTAGKNHYLALCAANRLVKEDSIKGSIPGLYEKVDEDGRFIYACYITSTYLDEHVRPERTEFDLIDIKKDNGIFDDSEISIQEIRDSVLEKTKLFLNDIITENILKGKKRIEDFVEHKAPRYRPMLKYIDNLIIDPSKSDKEVESFLHSQMYDIEHKLMEEGQQVLDNVGQENLGEYQNRIKNYLSKMSDLHMSDLANYVSHRKVILELLEKSLNLRDNGKYEYESVLHNLIMPMGKDSMELSADSCNLWLIDERLAFHHYMASDKKIKSMPITESSSDKEPDILGLQLFDEPFFVNNNDNPPYASITIIELKRPMRNDVGEGEEKNPIDQCLNYLNRIREGKVTTIHGRPVTPAKDIPGYCYVLCDLTHKMVEQCKLKDLNIRPDGLGYFGYHANYKAYIEVISFNLLLNAAKERNKAFFDKLGLPSV